MNKNSFLARWITGIVLAAILLSIILLASLEILTLVIAVIIAGGLWEYNHIVFGKGFLKEKIESHLFALALPFLALIGDERLLIAFMAFAVIIAFMVYLWKISGDNLDISSVAKVVFGLFYIPFLTSHFILLRKLDNGIYWIFLVLVIAIVGDTLALYVGKSMGRRKLIPLVSPGKTVEGTLGLIVGATLASCVFGYLLLPDIALWHFLILGFSGGIIGQLGDLCESAIKRNYGKKDASSLLPGHGGLLDRLDSLMFLAPYVYYYKIFILEL